jgi:hypothetical protein
MTAIGLGTRLKDRDGAMWEVTASDSGRWIASRLDGTSGPVRLSRSRLALDFNVTDAAGPPMVDEEHALAEFGAKAARAAAEKSPWSSLQAAHEAAIQAFGNRDED